MKSRSYNFSIIVLVCAMVAGFYYVTGSNYSFLWLLLLLFAEDK